MRVGRTQNGEKKQFTTGRAIQPRAAAKYGAAKNLGEIEGARLKMELWGGWGDCLGVDKCDRKNGETCDMRSTDKKKKTQHVLQN